jgi:hypothetical protein
LIIFIESEESSSATAIDHSIKTHKRRKKNKRRRSDQRQRYGNVGVQSLYYDIFTTFQCHNAYSYNSDKKALIISLLTNRKLVRTPPTVSENAEVSSWRKGSSKNDSSSLHSMMFEDNAGEDGLYHTLLISMTQIILINWHLIQQCLIMKFL